MTYGGLLVLITLIVVPDYLFHGSLTVGKLVDMGIRWWKS